MNQDPRAFQQNARTALQDPLLRPALGRLKTHFGAGRAAAVARYGDFESLRVAGRDIRDYDFGFINWRARFRADLLAESCGCLSEDSLDGRSVARSHVVSVDMSRR